MGSSSITTRIVYLVSYYFIWFTHPLMSGFSQRANPHWQLNRDPRTYGLSSLSENTSPLADVDANAALSLQLF